MASPDQGEVASGETYCANIPPSPMLASDLSAYCSASEPLYIRRFWNDIVLFHGGMPSFGSIPPSVRGKESDEQRFESHWQVDSASTLDSSASFEHLQVITMAI